MTEPAVDFLQVAKWIMTGDEGTNPTMTLRLNDIIRLPDGRVGTICYHFLDGDGGVWGRHEFEMPDGGFGDDLPAPQFMLREKSVEPLLRRGPHRHDIECVGIHYEREEPQP